MSIIILGIPTNTNANGIHESIRNTNAHIYTNTSMLGHVQISIQQESKINQKLGQVQAEKEAKANAKEIRNKGKNKLKTLLFQYLAQYYPTEKEQIHET